MYFALLLVWFVLNGRVTWDVTLVGIPLCAAIEWFGCRYCDWGFGQDWRLVQALPKIGKYLVQLVAAVIQSNLAVVKLILTPGTKEIKPRIFFFDTHLTQDGSKTVLANSITLTPGTITVNTYDSVFAVHALNAGFEAGTPDSDINKTLLAVEAIMDDGKKERGQKA